MSDWPSINRNLVHATDPGTTTPNAEKPEGVGATEATYGDNSFNPNAEPASVTSTIKYTENWGAQKEVESVSIADITYTSARKLKKIFNRYPSNTKSSYSVFAYISDWSQYDNRYIPGCTNAGGRGFDYTGLADSAYDKLVMGFSGILGFAGSKGASPSLTATMNSMAFIVDVISDESETA
ncbi:MAG: hypothetical protein K2Q15_13980, partial [Burkholderiales bacterium]|nr:hypothetical protein [Burkholderiales bacterium]